MIIILIINLNYHPLWNIFNIVYNVKSNKQFLIFTGTAWTRPDNICQFSDPTRHKGQPNPRETLVQTFCFLYHFHDDIFLFSGPWSFYLSHVKNILCMYVYVSRLLSCSYVLPINRQRERALVTFYHDSGTSLWNVSLERLSGTSRNRSDGPQLMCKNCLSETLDLTASEISEQWHSPWSLAVTGDGGH